MFLSHQACFHSQNNTLKHALFPFQNGVYRCLPVKAFPLVPRYQRCILKPLDLASQPAV